MKVLLLFLQNPIDHTIHKLQNNSNNFPTYWESNRMVGTFKRTKKIKKKKSIKKVKINKKLKTIGTQNYA